MWIMRIIHEQRYSVPQRKIIKWHKDTKYKEKEETIVTTEMKRK